MRRIGLVAFGTTVAVLAPAAIARLTAGPEQVARLFAPSRDSILLDGTRIAASLDRVVVASGESVRLRLHSDGAQRVTVGVVVLGSSATEGDRVPSPPIGVLHQDVTLVPDASGRAVAELPIRLSGARTREYRPLESYRIYVLSPAGATHLDAVQRHAHRPEPSDGEIPKLGRGMTELLNLLGKLDDKETFDDDKRLAALYASGSVARLDAHARPQRANLAVTVPDTARRDAPFHATVTVTNATSRPIADIALRIAFPTIDESALPVDDQADATGLPEEPFTLAPHEAKRIDFTVTPKRTGILAVQAATWCEACDKAGLDTVTFDAVDVIDAVPAVSQASVHAGPSL